MNKSIKVVLILIVILILIAIGIIIYTNNLNEEQYIENNSIAENSITDNQIQDARNDTVSILSETSRIKSYVGQFFTAIESKSYQKAYNMLFEEFKNNYFSTIENFEEYVKNTYPQNIVLEYTNITREGTIYIISLEIIDGVNNTNKFEQRVVITENNLNDFNISFQVDTQE